MTVNKKTEKINNEIKEQAAFSFNVVGGTGKVTNFTPGNNGTVQPVALLRLGVFVPAPPGVAKKNLPEGLVTMDVSRDLQHMQIASSEGYKEISLSSPRLDMGTDFRVWLGIVRSLHDHGHYSGRIKLPFSTFLKNCGFDPSRSNKPMKQRIDASMIKLKMVTFQFRNEDSTLTTGLINWARYNIKTAICILGLEFIHSNPRLLVGQKAASGWIFLFFTTLRESNIGWILRRALSRVNPTLHLLPASTMSECAAHTRPCLVLLEYHCQPCGLLWSTTSLHG